MEMTPAQQPAHSTAVISSSGTDFPFWEGVLADDEQQEEEKIEFHYA